jgi:hypothetical protein
VDWRLVVTRIILLAFVLGGCLLPVAWTQGPTSVPPPELKAWEIWVGDWTLVGTAKDAATETEYKVDWKMEGRRTLGGFFVEVRNTWKGKGAELSWLEILYYDRARRIHAFSGFESDGVTWVGTATFTPGICVETETDTGTDGKISTWQYTWNVSPDGKSISGKAEREQDGVRWTAFTVRGTKTKPPAANH